MESGTLNPKPFLSNQTYDLLKKVVTVVLPGLGTLYFALAGIWSLPAAEQVVGTITALVTFLGLLLGLASRSYNNSDARFDGVIDVSEDDDGNKTADLILKNYHDPADVVHQSEVTFKVNPPH